MQQPDNTRNTIIFVVCTLVMLIVYQQFVLGPQAKRKQAEIQARAAAEQAQKAKTPQGTASTGPAGQPPSVAIPRAEAAAASPRVAIDAPDLKGTISLKGGRIDDLFLKRYRETLAKNSPLVELFRPEGAEHAFFADFGWVGANLPGLPSPETLWQAAPGQTLSPAHPLVMTYDNGAGLKFTRVVTVDEHYMFTVTDTAANFGSGVVTIAPYASVDREGLPNDLGKSGVVHEGAIGWAPDAGKKRKQYKYKDWKKHGQYAEPSTGGWFGITDKYWLAAVIPDQRESVNTTFRVATSNGVDVYDASFRGAAHNIAPGRQVTVTHRLFAGAKVVPVLRAYEKSLAIPHFDEAVDWGIFSFFTRPIFQVLEIFYKAIGNFGLAIMLLTVAVKLVFFWPANKSYESITKMKKVQPDLERIKKKHGNDPAKQQQEMMALYQREKINPFMGCLPILVQIPVFFSLYKVLSVTIEMRQAPFFGWIHDLSVRDPSTIFNLFGLIPWDPATAPLIGAFLSGPLHIGIWPLIMGFTMWLSQSMSPTTGMDPVQQKIMQLFPLIFTFTMSQFAAGLVIYWSWNNLLSILQQYVIMRRFKVDNPIDQGLARLAGLAKPKATG
jgi:YidC/Oxa1 family membrane protein insertase